MTRFLEARPAAMMSGLPSLLRSAVLRSSQAMVLGSEDHEGDHLLSLRE